MKVLVSKVTLEDGKHKCDLCDKTKGIAMLKYSEADSVWIFYSCTKHWVETVDELEARLTELGKVVDMRGNVN